MLPGKAARNGTLTFAAVLLTVNRMALAAVEQD